MYVRWSLARGDALSARASRVGLRKLIENADVAAELDEVDVILGELASNVVRYGEDPMSIVAYSHEGVLMICTFDRGRGYDLDEKLSAEPSDERGRGLRILRSLSNGLSVHRESDEFCVCVSIALKGGQ